MRKIFILIFALVVIIMISMERQKIELKKRTERLNALVEILKKKEKCLASQIVAFAHAMNRIQLSASAMAFSLHQFDLANKLFNHTIAMDSLIGKLLTIYPNIDTYYNLPKLISDLNIFFKKQDSIEKLIGRW
ncbi:MAG: hypothetical protein QXI58_00635 [Candidatus Micrarchaeia archaeon]